MSALVRPGGEIGLARNCHKASYHACYLGDLVIHSLYPQWEPKFGINGGILPEDVEKLLKLDPKNTELLSQKQKLLADSIATTKEKLTTLKTAAEQANTALANGEISQEQYDALQREIIETEQELRNLETEAGKASDSLKQIGEAGEILQNVGDKIFDVGATLTTKVTVPIAAAGTAAVKTASDFDSAMSKVAAVSGATGDDLEKLRDKLVKWVRKRSLSIGSC